jgi:hypothetical protein
MATPRFGADRIKDVPPLNLLDALYAQGVSQDYLRQLLGMTTPEITSFLLRDNQDRNLLDRAVNMAQGKELAQFGAAGSDFDKLKVALTNRGVDLGGYNGPKDVNSLTSWAQNHVNPQVVGNAVATALPSTRMAGGRSISDDDRRGVTMFSQPQEGDLGVTPTTLRGIPSEGERGVHGQTAPNAADIAAAGGNRAAATPPAGTNTPTPRATPSPTSGPGALDKVDNPANWDDDRIKTFIKGNFGANAYFIDIPEVWNALKNVVKNGQGIAGLEPALEGTQFYKQTSSSARLWYLKQQQDPASAAADIAQQTQATTSAARDLGITLDPERAREISESYLRYGWTQTDLQRALSAEWHYDPSSKQQATVVTNMKQTASNWLVPLSDQAIQTWGQGLISGTTTQDQFSQYLRDNAKSLFPQLASMIDAHAGDANFDVSHFADPYRQHAANTLGIQPDQVDFADPKWRQALDQIDPKTGDRRIMTLSEWDATLKSNPAFGYDKTQNGVNDAMGLAKSLASSLGF